MKLKSYFAETVEEAISLALREMGPDAMLVNTKRTGAETRHLGTYEVICALETQSGRPGRPGDESRIQQAPPVDKLSQQVAELKGEMERLATRLARSGSGMSAIQSDPELAKAFAKLTDADLDPELAYNAIAKTASTAQPSSLRAELGRLVSVNAELGCPESNPRVAAFVGPPGSGKTTSLVKLAVQYSVATRTPAQILSMDTYRIGAADQLRTYASILGIGFQALDTTAGLAQALQEYRQKELILIDTPGLTRTEMDDFEDLATFFATWPGLDTHLVLPASMRTGDLKRTMEQYEVFKPGKLLFTRLDETGTFGPLLSQSVRSGKPISFLARGQRIPEDLEAATQERILDLIAEPEQARQPSMETAAA